MYTACIYVDKSRPAEEFSTASSTHDQSSVSPGRLSSSPLTPSSPCQTNTTPSPSPVTTEEIEAEIKADAGVVEALRELQRSFSCTLVKIKRFLQLHNCDLSDAQLFLDSLTDTKDFSSCDNFDKLLRLLQEQEYIDTFNIAGLKDLVACFDRDGLTEIVEDYNEKKETFLKNTTVLSFQRAVVSMAEPVLPRGKATLTIKISRKLASHRTLKDIEELAMEGFEEGHKSLIRLHAKPGSIIMSWVFPEALSGRLEQLFRDNTTVFKDAEVEEVTIDGKKVYPVIQQEV